MAMDVENGEASLFLEYERLAENYKRSVIECKAGLERLHCSQREFHSLVLSWRREIARRVGVLGGLVDPPACQ